MSSQHVDATADAVSEPEAVTLDISRNMTEAGIIPALVDAIGNVDLKVTFPSGAIMRHGNQLTTTQVKDRPAATWAAEPGAYYTMIFTDPDAPSRYLPLVREVFHWIVMNAVDGDAATGETIYEYIPSGPPPLTGPHRYVVFVFKQPAGKIAHDERHVPSNAVLRRVGCSTRKFARNYGLGSPIGGNFYTAKYGSG